MSAQRRSTRPQCSDARRACVIWPLRSPTEKGSPGQGASLSRLVLGRSTLGLPLVDIVAQNSPSSQEETESEVIFPAKGEKILLPKIAHAESAPRGTPSGADRPVWTPATPARVRACPFLAAHFVILSALPGKPSTARPTLPFVTFLF